MNSKSYKTVLHTIEHNETIHFKDENSGDKVDISFVIEDSEEGFYSEEYKVRCKDYEKKADITCGIIKKNTNEVVWKVYEVKRSLTGEHVITKMFDQLEAGYHYLKLSVLQSRTVKDGSIGVFTSNYDEPLLKAKIIMVENKIKKASKNNGIPIGLQKMKPELFKLRRQVYCMNSLKRREYIIPKTSEKIKVDVKNTKKVDGVNRGDLIVNF